MGALVWKGQGSGHLCGPWAQLQVQRLFPGSGLCQLGWIGTCGAPVDLGDWPSGPSVETGSSGPGRARVAGGTGPLAGPSC